MNENILLVKKKVSLILGAKLDCFCFGYNTHSNLNNAAFLNVQRFLF